MCRRGRSIPGAGVRVRGATATSVSKTNPFWGLGNCADSGTIDCNDTGLPIPGAVLNRELSRSCCHQSRLRCYPVISVWSAISVVAGARNHRSRLASPSRWMSSDCRTSSPPGPGSTDLIPWELGGNGPGNSWENEKRTGFPPGPALGRASSLAARLDDRRVASRDGLNLLRSCLRLVDLFRSARRPGRHGGPRLPLLGNRPPEFTCCPSAAMRPRHAPLQQRACRRMMMRRRFDVLPGAAITAPVVRRQGMDVAGRVGP